MNEEKLIIRQAGPDDVAKVAEIEEKCFPVAEAATLKSFFERFMAFPECFLVAEIDGKLVGHINGCVTSSERLIDALYYNTSLHEPDGPWQTVFGLAVLPEYQHRGIGRSLMEHFKEQAKKRGKKGILLTCKAEKIEFYESLGFEYDGASSSTHGGAHWNNMILRFSEEGEKA